MKHFRRIIIIVGWLLLWQMVSVSVNNKILLVGPVDTIRALTLLMTKGEFWISCVGTFLRIVSGFAAGALLGVFLAMCSARYKVLEEILAPLMTLIKVIPVVSFVVIFLIWWGSEYLAILISFFVVLPNMYVNTLEGIKSTDRKLLEMAQVFEVSAWNRFFYIYRPALKPFLDSAVKVSAGMSWKAGVAAEVIGLPKNAIGEGLYMSKIYLETADVLAWTLVIVLLSVAFEKGVLYLWKQFGEWQPACRNIASPQRLQIQAIKLSEVSKSYYDKAVIEDLTAEYEPDKIYHFSTPSGSGKTTLFRLIAGLEAPDKGVIELKRQRVAFLFQEDRLCEEYSALKNVEIVTGNKGMAKTHLLQLLEETDIHKPCSELSGGMKRRVAIARAFAANADIILLDEPYNGLDETNRTRVQQYIERNRVGCIVLMASHIR